MAVNPFQNFMVRYGAGERVFTDGDLGTTMYIVQSGKVRLFRMVDGGKRVHGMMEKGDFFGEMCILETLPRSATVQATEDATLYSLSSIVFYQLYESLPRQYGILLVNIARDLSRRLRHLDEVFAGRH